jgi:hypothetical protein
MQAELKRDESGRWRLVGVAAIIVGAVLLVYLPALRAGFVWDDEQLITSNPLLRTFSGLIEIWSGGRTADYFPITNTAFWIEHHLCGDNPLGYHALNILLQAADAVPGLAGFASLANSGRVVRRTDFRHSSGPRGIRRVDFRTEKCSRDVFHVVVDLVFS